MNNYNKLNLLIESLNKHIPITIGEVSIRMVEGKLYYNKEFHRYDSNNNYIETIFPPFDITFNQLAELAEALTDEQLMNLSWLNVQAEQFFEKYPKERENLNHVFDTNFILK